MRAQVAILVFSLAGVCAAQTVRIGVFGLFRPTHLEVRGAGESQVILRCEPHGEVVECISPGGVVSDPASLGLTEFSLAVPGKITRRFHGNLGISVENGVLVPVVTMDLEDAVAAAVAAESLSSAPPEALKAQAIVTRSYYVAGRERHRGFDFCDTTHCQFLREKPAHFTAALEATRATRGIVLAWKGTPFAALFSASCGGLTAVPSGPTSSYPYFAVNCSYCRKQPRVRCHYCVRNSGSWPNQRGRGAGHGSGLCQTGGVAMAQEGARASDILRYYFPNAVMQRAP